MDINYNSLKSEFKFLFLEEEEDKLMKKLRVLESKDVSGEITRKLELIKQRKHILVCHRIEEMNILSEIKKNIINYDLIDVFFPDKSPYNVEDRKEIEDYLNKNFSDVIMAKKVDTHMDFDNSMDELDKIEETELKKKKDLQTLIDNLNEEKNNTLIEIGSITAMKRDLEESSVIVKKLRTVERSKIEKRYKELKKGNRIIFVSRG